MGTIVNKQSLFHFEKWKKNYNGSQLSWTVVFISFQFFKRFSFCTVCSWLPSWEIQATRALIELHVRDFLKDTTCWKSNILVVPSTTFLRSLFYLFYLLYLFYMESCSCCENHSKWIRCRFRFTVSCTGSNRLSLKKHQTVIDVKHSCIHIFSHTLYSYMNIVKPLLIDMMIRWLTWWSSRYIIIKMVSAFI